jgi:hypothetical protein
MVRVMSSDDLPIGGWMVAWTPYSGDAIEVGPWPDKSGWSDRYRFTGGCCFEEVRALREPWQIAAMFIDFHTVTVRDRIDPDHAHREFCKIAEFRRRISPEFDEAE